MDGGGRPALDEWSVPMKRLTICLLVLLLPLPALAQDANADAARDAEIARLTRAVELLSSRVEMLEAERAAALPPPGSTIATPQAPAPAQAPIAAATAQTPSEAPTDLAARSPLPDDGGVRRTPRAHRRLDGGQAAPVADRFRGRRCADRTALRAHAHRLPARRGPGHADDRLQRRARLDDAAHAGGHRPRRGGADVPAGGDRRGHRAGLQPVRARPEHGHVAGLAHTLERAPRRRKPLDRAGPAHQ